ncbi:MAG: hypothetical protein V4813_15515 [Gemmatimonadota bacterium]
MTLHRTCVVLAAATALFLPPRSLEAQARFDLPIGQRVKVEYADSVRLVPIGRSRHQLTGVLVADPGDVVQLRLPTGDIASLRRDALKRAWVSRGVSRRRSAFATALSFAATGYLLSSRQSWRGNDDNTTRDALIGAAVGAGIGTAVGLIRPFETWKGVRR